MNPNTLFYLAGYAHQHLSPLMEPLNASLQVVMDFDGKFPGVQVWVFTDTLNHALAHRTGIKTTGQLDELIAEVKELASVTV